MARRHGASPPDQLIIEGRPVRFADMAPALRQGLLASPDAAGQDWVDALRHYVATDPANQADAAAKPRAPEAAEPGAPEAAEPRAPEAAEPGAPEAAEPRVPGKGLTDRLAAARAPGKGLIDQLAAARPPRGRLMPLFGALLLLLFAIVPANAAGDTRLSLLFKALTGGVALPISAATLARREAQAVAAGDDAAITTDGKAISAAAAQVAHAAAEAQGWGSVVWGGFWDLTGQPQIGQWGPLG